MGKKWNADATPGGKLLALYTTLLFSGREMTLSELARLLDCSKQTIGRLVIQLEASSCGKVMRLSRGREAAYALDRPKNLPRLPLDAEGLAQLTLCRDFIVRLLPETMRRKILQTLNLAAGFLPPEKSARPGIGLGLFKGAVDYEPHLEKLEALRQAIQDRRLCAVAYQADRSRPAKNYDFAPKKLLAFQGGLMVVGWRVEGRRAKYDRPATLALQRLLRVEILERSGNHLPEPETENGAFGLMDDETFTAVVRFQPEAAAYVEERRWSAEQTAERGPDGSLTLTFQARSYLEVLSWVLSFGPQAETLAPDWLRAETVGAARAMAALYERPGPASGRLEEQVADK